MNNDPHDVFYDFGVALEHKAIELTDSADLDDWHRCLGILSDADFDMLLLFRFFGMLSNSGSFVFSAGSFKEWSAELKSAFLFVGAPRCVALTEEAIELCDQFERAGGSRPSLLRPSESLPSITR